MGVVVRTTMGDYHQKGNLQMSQHDHYRTSSAFYEGVERNRVHGGQIGRKFLDPSDPVDAMSDEDVRETLSRMGIDPRGFNPAGCRLQLRMNSQRAPTNLDRAWYEMHPDVNSLQHTVWQLEEDNKKLSFENDKLHQLLHGMESDGGALTKARQRIQDLVAELLEAKANVRPDMSDQVALEKSKKQTYKGELEQLREQLRLSVVRVGQQDSQLTNLNAEHQISDTKIGNLNAENEALRKQMHKLGKDGLSLEQLGLGKQYRFDKRVYRVEPLVQIKPDRDPIDNGISFRTEPDPSKKTTEGHASHNRGPSNTHEGQQHRERDADGNEDPNGKILGPECIIADAMIQGPDGVYVRDSDTKGWLPTMQKLPQGGPAVPVLKHLGKHDDLIARFDKPELGLLSEDGKSGSINIADHHLKVKTKGVTSPGASTPAASTPPPATPPPAQPFFRGTLAEQ